MNLLALDFSTSRRGVCVSSDRNDAVVTSDDRAAGPLGLITSALVQAGLRKSDIDQIAIGLGPGSYTGIRSSIAIAQGMQLGANVNLTGIPSADIIAWSASLSGEIAVVIDAQRGEFYCAKYRRDGETLETLAPLRIVSRTELEVLECPIVGPEVTRLLGRGTDVFPDPAKLARLARQSAAFVAGQDLEPIYLRAPEFKKAPPARQID